MRVEKLNADPKPNIGVYSLAAKENSKQIQTQFEFDVSSFRDPMGQKQFAGRNGVNPEVRDWVAQDKRIPAIMDACRLLANDLIKPHKKGDREETISQWLSISFRDFHGVWIAPAIAEAVAEKLSAEGYVVYVAHLALTPNKE